ncbi:protein pinocchio isoform X4 [Drosophila erecta]|uniref:protein pinocchio isoform X4 n=1 Tax=Drosophila erecta TaxID=7220 RepID=UPI000F052B31|nr:protein pinocchio isoform X4 [Drosophila erecta]
MPARIHICMYIPAESSNCVSLSLLEMKTGSNNNHISASSGSSNNNNSSMVQQQQQQRAATSVSVSSSHIVTEWEDGIIFDVDDPDFCNLATDKLNFIAHTNGHIDRAIAGTTLRRSKSVQTGNGCVYVYTGQMFRATQI